MLFSGYFFCVFIKKTKKTKIFIFLNLQLAIILRKYYPYKRVSLLYCPTGFFLTGKIKQYK